MSKKEFKEALKVATTPEARPEQKRKHVDNTDAAIKKNFQELAKSIRLVVGTDPRAGHEFIGCANQIETHLYNQSKRIIELEEEVERLNTLISKNVVKSISTEEQKANLERLESISDAIFRDLAKDAFDL